MSRTVTIKPPVYILNIFYENVFALLWMSFCGLQLLVDPTLKENVDASWI